MQTNLNVIAVYGFFERLLLPHCDAFDHSFHPRCGFIVGIRWKSILLIKCFYFLITLNCIWKYTVFLASVYIYFISGHVFGLWSWMVLKRFSLKVQFLWLSLSRSLNISDQIDKIQWTKFISLCATHNKIQAPISNSQISFNRWSHVR